MTTLNEILTLGHQIEGMLDENEGEVTQEIEELLAIFEGDLDTKLDSIKELIDYLKASSRYLKEKSDEFARKSKSRLNQVEHLKSMIILALEDTGNEKIKTQSYSFSMRETESIEVAEQPENVAFLAEVGLFNVKYAPDKKAIKDFMAENGGLDWVKINKKKSVTIR